MDYSEKKQDAISSSSASYNGLSLSDKRAQAKKLMSRKQTQKRSAKYPLSYGQQALYFIHQNAPTSAAYNEGFTFRIEGGVEADLLRKSFQLLLDRHDALRTRFDFNNGTPFQESLKNKALEFQLVQAENWSEDLLRQKVNTAFSRPFDLQSGAVFRVHLFQISPTEAVVLVGMHHIVTDGWSMNLLMTEF